MVHHSALRDTKARSGSTSDIVDLKAVIDFVRDVPDRTLLKSLGAGSVDGAAVEAIGRHLRLLHGGHLMVCDDVRQAIDMLTELGIQPLEAVPSTVVHSRVAARTGHPYSDFDVVILPCPTGSGRFVELFVVTGLPADSARRLAKQERGLRTEGHFAFTMDEFDPVVAEGVISLVLGALDFAVDGGGYNQYLDVTALYYRGQGTVELGYPRRFELLLPGNRTDLLGRHLGRTARAAEDDPARELLDVMTGAWSTQAISAAVGIGVFDELASGPRDSTSIAEATGSHEDNVTRLLRYLAGLGVLAVDHGGQFSLTPRGSLLRGDVDGSMAPLARLYGGLFYGTYPALEHCVRTGESAFVHVHGGSPFDYFAAHPDAARLFERAMAAGSVFLRDVPGVLDLDGVSSVVDVAGGDGLLLSLVLDRRPTLDAILFDRPHVIDAIGHNDRSRLELVAGDFFTDPVPAGADLYLLCRILHDWDDDRCLHILGTIREAMPAGRELVIIERPLPEEGEMARLALAYDIHMMVNNDQGRERTVSEYRRLLTATGFDLVDVRRLSLDMAAIVARAREE